MGSKKMLVVLLLLATTIDAFKSKCQICGKEYNINAFYDALCPNGCMAKHGAEATHLSGKRKCGPCGGTGNVDCGSGMEGGITSCSNCDGTGKCRRRLATARLMQRLQARASLFSSE